MLVDVRFECANLTRYRRMHYFSLSQPFSVFNLNSFLLSFGCSAKNIVYERLISPPENAGVDSITFFPLEAFIVVNFTFRFVS